MQNLTWKQLEEFLTKLTEEQKLRPVTLIDNNHESIFLIDDVGICDINYYAHFEGLFSDDAIDGADEDEIEEFMSEVYTTATKGDPILIID